MLALHVVEAGVCLDSPAGVGYFPFFFLKFFLTVS